MNKREYSTMNLSTVLVEATVNLIYGITQFIFLILHWCGVTNWAWYYLYLPTIIVLGLLTIVYFIILIILVIYKIILNKTNDKLSTTFVESLLSNRIDDDEDEEK